MSESKLKIMHNQGSGTSSHTMTITPTDTVDAIKRKIRSKLSHNGSLKLHFPGKTQLHDDDLVLSKFPRGNIVVHVDDSAIDPDNEQKQDQSAISAQGDTQQHKFEILHNVAEDEAKNHNLIAGLDSSQRPVKATINRNRTTNKATMDNRIVSHAVFMRQETTDPGQPSR